MSDTPLFRCDNCGHTCCEHAEHQGACEWSSCDCPALVSASPDPSVTRCHVYCVSLEELPAGRPEGDCWCCGDPLAGHEKRTSALMTPGQVYVIDEDAFAVGATLRV